MKTLTIFSITLLSSSFWINAQYQPKKITSREEYTHNSTSITFPLKIQKYNRSEIYAFDRKKTNIGVNYEYKETNGNTKFTIYIYPAGSGIEDRLRNEYSLSMKSVASFSVNGVSAIQHAISYFNSGYKINGFKAEFIDKSSKSNLSIFECGNWFFKVRVTSDILDSTELANLDSGILNYFNPVRLVQVSHLKSKASIYFNKSAFIDSLMLGSAMGSAYKKIEWAIENVDSLERASGFPDMYLDLQIESLKGFVNFEKDHPDFSKSKFTKDYLAQLNLIIDSGYIKEFVLEQFNMIMIIPENTVCDFEGFKNWKLENPININLQERFYHIMYK